MLTLLCASAGSLCVFLLFSWWLGATSALLPAIITLIAIYFTIARTFQKRIEGNMQNIQRLLQQRQIAGGIQQMKNMQKKYGRWQFFFKSSLDGEIGSLYYLQRDFARAQKHLEKSFVRHFMSKTMLGVLHYRAKDFEKMNKIFDRAVWYNPKQGLLWSTWAYCLWRIGKTQKAIEVLVRAKKKLGSTDPRIDANLLQLQNNKKMKMRGYGSAWYQLQLESPQVASQNMQRARAGRS